jgi:hypothetical protein
MGTELVTAALGLRIKLNASRTKGRIDEAVTIQPLSRP